MIRIPLSQGLVALIDDEDAHLSAFKWTLKKIDDRVYAYRHVYENGKIKTVFLHQMIVKGEADHKNRDGLDCRRENLRPCTRSQNLANRRLNKNNRSGMKGVCWATRERMWLARIWKDRKQIHLGYFASVEIAGQAYDTAARHLFGEFARLNFPRVGERGART